MGKTAEWPFYARDDFIKLLFLTDRNQKLVVLFADVHRCFPFFVFLFWLARSPVTGERQTKILKRKEAVREQRK